MLKYPTLHHPLYTHTQTQVYFISRGRLRPANKQFNTTKNDYELTFNEDSEIELVRTCLFCWLCIRDIQSLNGTMSCIMQVYLLKRFLLQCTDSVSDSQLPTLQYNFRHIADLENVEPNQLVGKSSVLLL